jgi:hypothetical protein
MKSREPGSTGIDSGLSRTLQTGIESLTRDKYSSLFHPFRNNDKNVL